MILCSLKLSIGPSEVVHTFEFHPELLTSESTKLSFDQAFETIKSKAIAIKLDTYPQLPTMGLRSVKSLEETVEMLQAASTMIGKSIDSPIQITRLKTKDSWMIILEGK